MGTSKKSNLNVIGTKYTLGVHLDGYCLPEMKKTLKYKLKLSLVKNGDREGEIEGVYEMK